MVYFLFRILVSRGGAWVCRDDFLDSRRKIGSLAPVRLWLIWDGLAHILHQLGPLIHPYLGACCGGAPLTMECHCDHSEDSAVSRIVCIVAVIHTDFRRDGREVVLGHIVDSSGFIIWVCVDDADFALCILPVTFKDCDLFGVGGDCAAFEDDK